MTTTTALTDSTVTVWDGRLKVHVKKAGSGPPAVYFHPAGGLRWDGFLETLASRFTVYAPEHPGTSEGDPTAIDQVDDLWDLVLIYDEVLDGLGLDSAVLLGQSFGGMIACEVAASFPRRASKLVLLDPAGLWREDAPVANYMWASPPELANMLFMDPRSDSARQMFTPPADPEVAAVGAARLVWAIACTSKFVWPIPDRGLSKRLHRVNAETLIVWGEYDRLIPVSYANDFGSKIRRSRIQIIENAGHIPQLEQQAKTTQIVLDFLTG
jgi:pimeloyl-ACP methyl ester carboxylesterase